jgi:signal transduction histidine kinase
MEEEKIYIINKISDYKDKLIEIIKANNAVSEEVASYNINRLYYTALFAIPVHLTNIIIFCCNESIGTPNEIKWQMAIRMCHISLAVIMVFLGGIARFLRKQDTIHLFTRIMIGTAITTILLFGILITVIDQLVTPNITPFLVACTIAAVVFLMRPFFAALIYTGSFTLYYKALEWTQYDENILLSNRVNGITAVVIGFGLSVVLWKSHCLNFKQKRHIEIQKSNLEQKNKELLELNQVKDKLFTVITHDIRQPLVTMVSLMDLLEDDIEELSSDSNKIIQDVKQQIHHSYSMVDSLLDWCKNQRSGFSFQPHYWELHETVCETVDLLRSEAEAKGIKIINTITPGMDVFIDKAMFDLVLRNILTNAIKFTGKDGFIRIKAVKKIEKVIIAIQDTGVGIDQTKIQELLNAKNVNPTIGTAGEKGIGLGLQLCKDFIHRNGGDLWAESMIGKGSTFYIAVPVGKNA